jgi:hypothetical protein
MIPTLLKLYWTNLRRDRVAQMMTFLLPVAFFSIFALVFGGRHEGTAKIPVAVADEDRTPTSRSLRSPCSEGEPRRARRAPRAPRRRCRSPARAANSS